jgi:hypothetical protein
MVKAYSRGRDPRPFIWQKTAGLPRLLPPNGDGSRLPPHSARRIGEGGALARVEQRCDWACLETDEQRPLVRGWRARD